MSLIAALSSLLYHDLLSAWRRKSDWINATLFFVLVVSLFPLAITPEDALLHTIAPGLIWVAALLAMLLGLPYFLKPDYQAGSLHVLLLSPHPLPLLLLAKTTAHWLTSGFPLMLISPLLALFLHLSAHETMTLMWALLWGTPVLSLVGGVAVALTIALESQSLLLALLVLPLCVPVLVFGAGVVVNAGLGLPTHGILSLLASFFVLSLTLAPWAASGALRLGEF
jgi:heme exporter protein B